MTVHRSVWRTPNQPPSSVEITPNLYLKGTYGNGFYFNLPVPLPCPYASLKCLPPHHGWELAQGLHRIFPISLLGWSYLLLPFHVPLCTPASPHHAICVVLPEDAIFVLLHPMCRRYEKRQPVFLSWPRCLLSSSRSRRSQQIKLFSRIMRCSLYPQLQQELLLSLMKFSFQDLILKSYASL